MDYDLWATIRRLFEVDKLSKAAIARRLHLDRVTVRRALAFKEAPPPRAVASRPSKHYTSQLGMFTMIKPIRRRALRRRSSTHRQRT